MYISIIKEIIKSFTPRDHSLLPSLSQKRFNNNKTKKGPALIYNIGENGRYGVLLHFQRRRTPSYDICWQRQIRKFVVPIFFSLFFSNPIHLVMTGGREGALTAYGAGWLGKNAG